MNLSQEKALIARCKKDPQAFGRIFDAHFDSIFRFALLRLADASMAEDVTAQTFYKALKNLWRFRFSGAPFLAWLFRIAMNEVNGCLRKQARRKRLEAAPLIDCIEDQRYRPDRELAAAEEALKSKRDFLELHACISQLKLDDQAVIVLRYFENKPFAEIARIMGKREGALRMRNMRALDRLKELMKKRGIDYERDGRKTEASIEAGSEGRVVPARPAPQSS